MDCHQFDIVIFDWHLFLLKLHVCMLFPCTQPIASTLNHKVQTWRSSSMASSWNSSSPSSPQSPSPSPYSYSSSGSSLTSCKDGKRSETTNFYPQSKCHISLVHNDSRQARLVLLHWCFHLNSSSEGSLEIFIIHIVIHGCWWPIHFWLSFKWPISSALSFIHGCWWPFPGNGMSISGISSLDLNTWHCIEIKMHNALTAVLVQIAWPHGQWSVFEPEVKHWNTSVSSLTQSFQKHLNLSYEFIRYIDISTQTPCVPDFWLPSNTVFSWKNIDVCLNVFGVISLVDCCLGLFSTRWTNRWCSSKNIAAASSMSLVKNTYNKSTQIEQLVFNSWTRSFAWLGVAGNSRGPKNT